MEKDEAPEKPKTIKEKIRAATLAKRASQLKTDMTEQPDENLPALSENKEHQPYSYLDDLRKYTPEKAASICVQVADGNKSLLKICEEHGIARPTFFSWVFKIPELMTNYMHARLSQADSMDDNIIEIVNDMKAGGIDPHAAKVAISAYQWRAERLKPKVYGAQSQITHVREESAGTIGRMTIEELQALRSRIMAAPMPVIDGEAKEVSQVKPDEQPTESNT